MILTASAGLLGLISPSASASNTQVEACNYFANPPGRVAGGQIAGKGGRTGCGTNPVTLEVVVNKRLAGRPDITVAKRRFEGFVTGNIVATGSCAGSGRYFTETRVVGTVTKVQSAESQLC
nr:hypothetical protein [Kibdelosporangium sp. MJ126-NF4]CTQ99058.1 hypothetical protein [Kibdelosporangium sp. MJ126-NF4]